MRCRLRAVLWKQGKRWKRRKAALLRLGVPEALAVTTAWSAKGPWRMCHTTGGQLALPASYFATLSDCQDEPLTQTCNSTEPPWYGPVCPVGWEEGSREASPYPDLSKFFVTCGHQSST